MGSKTFPAPVGGWVSSAPLAMPGQATARKLVNWFPTSTGVRPRAGTLQRARIGTDDPVVSMFTYSGSGVSKLFGATSDSVFDITSPADPDVAPTALFSGRTSGYYSFTQIANVAGSHFYAVNGDDKPLYYDGSTMVEVDGASTPAITGVTTSDLSAVWTYANRLFFAKKDSLEVHYLAVDAIGGAVSTLTLAGAMKLGGSVLFGATWSMDAGDGLDDKCVFVSTMGEVAVAEGTDPSDPTTWRLVGVYEIGVPLGKRAFFRVGGELMIATADGVIPLSTAIQADRSQLSLGAVTKAIEPDWRREANARITAPVECIRWPEERMLIVANPVAFEGQEEGAFVANIETKAWCEFRQIDVNCLAYYAGRAYFGTQAGTIHEFEATGSDDGALYTCSMILTDDSLGSLGATKTLKQGRATFRATHNVSARLSASTDYAVSLPPAPSSIADFATSIWDSGLWDSAIWDAGRGEYETRTTRWQSIGQTGFSFLIACQVAIGITPAPDAELVTIDVTYEEGGLVV